ncbi:transcription elongation factor GreA [Butyricicoccus porcorum]|uniref:Transcription elongation factor GreA n=1 Tax=Butyricicoccus porcorum TaxID=1945634 RepID=A0A252F7G8_9FIRM|nr:transcription elongation factor GreA [Butyricicoccus porcorum]MCI6927129.1 transcription elongation factor GreA [Butyricicoccus porcorum]MDD6986233.1 transcription elongation factor GreA [Butyricicoccus porcorum]MDY4482993.1 transcription elongation factor GreA [Butyricicoccus porcorum]OUM21718.1 transcription elongation factor GreA [Butyricicoccus porcorum]
MKQEFKLTQENLDKLKDELEYLKTVRMQEVAEQIKEARSFGDLSENAEYDEAKNEQGKVASRIAELETIIANAVIISEDMYAKDEVSPGCRFKVLDLEFDEEEEYHFVGSQEADPMDGKISDESPFGKAVLGHKVGDIVDVVAPNETTVQFKITEIIK